MAAKLEVLLLGCTLVLAGCASEGVRPTASPKDREGDEQVTPPGHVGDHDADEGEDATPAPRANDDAEAPAGAAGQGEAFGEWTYFTVDGAICRDGSPAGYYIRKGESSNLLIFLNGGGICYDDFFCGINPANVNSS